MRIQEGVYEKEKIKVYMHILSWTRFNFKKTNINNKNNSLQ